MPIVIRGFTVTFKFTPLSHVPLTMTSAVSECAINGSLGRSKLALHVNLQVPAEAECKESTLVLTEFPTPA